VVVWVTGLSDSGKTTLCRALTAQLKPYFPQLVSLDGGLFRTVLGHDLGFKESDRVIHVKRVQRLAKYLSDQGSIVLVAVLYSHPDLLAWNRENIRDYFEIYLDISISTLRERDSKGLYKKISSGEIKHVVGVDIPWHVPTQSDLVIRENGVALPDQLAVKVIQQIPRFSSVLVNS
jgi:cytidine diphosphoramidate kinase